MRVAEKLDWKGLKYKVKLSKVTEMGRKLGNKMFHNLYAYCILPVG
jgi:hypothetical protein